MVGPPKKRVNIKKTMGPRGSLHKQLGVAPGTKIGAARLKKAAAAGSKKAALALTLHHEWGGKKKPNG